MDFVTSVTTILLTIFTIWRWLNLEKWPT